MKHSRPNRPYRRRHRKGGIPDLYARLVNLLGKGENDPLFADLLNDIGDVHGVLDETVFRVHQCLPLGFQIIFNALHDRFSSVIFLIKCPAIDSGGCLAYAGDFLHGICTSDVRSEVQRKMEEPPARSGLSRGSRWSADCNVDIYELDQFDITFRFDTRNDEMSSASVRLRNLEADRKP